MTYGRRMDKSRNSERVTTTSVKPDQLLYTWVSADMSENHTALISHELRTPLTAIRGALGLILSGKLGDTNNRIRRLLQIACQNTERLMRLTHAIEGDPNLLDAVLDAVDLEQLRLANELHSAIIRQDLYLQFQPIFSLETMEIRGFEALCRWHNLRVGEVPPDVFIPLAESSTAINHLGHWVLQEACGQLSKWLAHTPLFVSVNVAPSQILNAVFVAQVQDILDSTGIPPQFLHLEITESVFSRNFDAALRILYQLKDLGVKLYIDDFGVGYSCLSRLVNFPIDAIKIDRSFIHRANWNVIETIILLAQKQKLEIIAEGAETIWQVDQLRSLGCHKGQGYYFARPMDIANATKMLTENLAIA